MNIRTSSKVGDDFSSEENISSQSSDVESVLGGSKKSELDTLSDWGPIGFKKSNHPLSIMASVWGYGVHSCVCLQLVMCVFTQVASERTDLLKHPLVTSLLNHKWQRYGEWFYSTNVLVYIVFLIFLTAFALSIHSPLEVPCKSVTWCTC